jgi:uncharacterized protein (TIGR02246 family)
MHPKRKTTTISWTSAAGAALCTALFLLGPVPDAAAHGEAVPAASDKDVAAAVAAGNAAFSAAFERGDAAAIAALYTEDAVLLPSGGRNRQQGRASIERFFTLAPGVEVVDHSLETTSLEVKGDTAVEIGRWTSVTRRDGGEPRKGTGPYLLVWERGGDGAWRVDYDVWQAE